MRTNNNAPLRQSFARNIGVAAVALFTACDTSSSLQSGIEGTGAPSPAPVVAVSRGRIDGIDGLTVAVNGVNWSASNANTSIDGEPSTAAALKPGMIATVQGERAGTSRGTANMIETQIVVRGPILAIDGARSRLNVLGQSVVVDRRTNLDVGGASLDAFSVGQVVAVSGFIMAGGEVRATLVATPIGAATQDWLVTGAVTGIDAAARRFAINGLQVEHTAGVLSALPSGAVEIGQRLTVFGRGLTADGALLGSRISSYDPSLPAIGAETVVSGMIARIEDDGISFWNQRIVLLSGAEREPLVVGAYVRATGTMRGGVLYASDVTVLGSGPLFVYLIGYIDALDIAGRKLTMLGAEFTVSETVRLDTFAVGHRVRVVAYGNRFVSGVQSAHGWPYEAERLVLIEGEFADLSPPTQFTLHGVADWIVQVAPDTYYGYHWLGDKDECYAITVSAERFWELASQPKPPGVTTVWAWGRFEGDILLARSTGICFPSAP